jgi:tRNA(Ile)-lysidine synthase
MLETALMRVLRGAGPAGLAAMPVRNGKILRPLLSISRAGVTGYLKEKKIPWREDSTNNDDRFLRNRIRRHLIPLLDESFPEWRMAVAGMAATQTLAAAFISNEAIRRVVWKAANKYARAGSREQETEALSPAAGCSLTFTDADNFFSQPLVIREEALFGGIDRLLAGKAGSAQIKRSVIRQFCAGVVNAADLGSVRVIRKEGKVLLSRVLKQYSEQGFSLLIKEPGLYNLNRVSIELRPFSTERKKGAFYSCLPLTFRQSFKDDFLVGEDGKMARRDVGKKLISAVDRFGIAAFINPGGGVLSKRYLPASGREDKEMYTVTIINNKAGGSYV